MKPLKQTTKSTELATRTRPTSELTKGMPDFLQTGGSAPAGLENMERQDIVLPRLALCQSGTPQRKKSDQKYITGLEEGQWFNTITREIYGETVKIVPLLFFKTRILFNPYEQGGGIRCQALDNRMGVGDPGGECAKCPMAQFGPKGERPQCNQFYNYASLVANKDGSVSPDGLVVVSFKSTSLKTSREWNTLIRLRRTDMFAGFYELSTAAASNKVGSWVAPVINVAGWVTKDAYEGARIAYEAVAELNKAGRLRHDVSDLEPGRDPEETSAL